MTTLLKIMIGVWFFFAISTLMLVTTGDHSKFLVAFVAWVGGIMTVRVMDEIVHQKRVGAFQ